MEKVMEFKQAFSFLELYKCHTLCRRNKQHKNETINFELNLARKLAHISKELMNKTYSPLPYRSFYVFEPKKRIIDSLSYSHRIVQRSLCDNILRPRLEKVLIYDNAACRVNKGTHFALDRLKKFIKLEKINYGKNFYFLQCDIKKYFQNIDHDNLKNMIAQLNFEPNTNWLINTFIDTYSYETRNGKKYGIPIGNQTSQWFALLYLNGMDKFIKEKLRIKFYVRYMDDFILIHHSKKYLKYCYEQIKNYVESLGLFLNHKTQINKITRGISFLGFRTTISANGGVIRLLKGGTKTRLKNNYKKLRFLYKYNAIDDEYLKIRFTSYKNHYFHASCHRWFYGVMKRQKFERKQILQNN